MKRLLVISAAALLAFAPSVAFAQGAATPAPKADAAQSKPKTLTTNGTVSAVSSDSLTVKAASGEMTFSVDAKTTVVGPGVGTKEAALKKEGKPAAVTEFLKAGDRVTVTYHEMGATKHAAQVRLTPPAK
jgi:hypothetical protein